MKKQLNFLEKISYFLAVLTVFLLFLFLACACGGAKKTNKEETKTDSLVAKTETAKVKETEKIKEVTKIDSSAMKSKKLVIDSEIDELIFGPVDPKLESSITDSNGKTTIFKNLKGSTKKSKSLTTEQYDEVVRKLEKSETEIARLKDSIYDLNVDIAVNKKVSKKDTDQEQFNWGKFAVSFWWLWLFLALAAYIGYCYVRNINPFKK